MSPIIYPSFVCSLETIGERLAKKEAIISRLEAQIVQNRLQEEKKIHSLMQEHKDTVSKLEERISKENLKREDSLQSLTKAVLNVSKSLLNHMKTVKLKTELANNTFKNSSPTQNGLDTVLKSMEDDIETTKRLQRSYDTCWEQMYEFYGGCLPLKFAKYKDTVEKKVARVTPYSASTGGTPREKAKSSGNTISLKKLFNMEGDFPAAVEKIAEKGKADGMQGVPKNDKLALYKFYKQATYGDNNTPKPGILNFKSLIRWNAWKEVKGMSKDDAKKKYIEVANKFI